MIFKEYKTPLDLLEDLQRVLGIGNEKLVIKVKTIITMDYEGRDEKAISLDVKTLYNKFKINYRRGNLIFNIDTLDSIKIIPLSGRGNELILMVSRSYTIDKLRELQRTKRIILE